MPELTKPKNKENWEYVTIPDTDPIMDWPHPGVRINYNHYGPGTHLVDPESASTIRTRLEMFNRSQANIIRSHVDVKALKAVGRSYPGVVQDASDNARPVR